jgi:TRAP-type C4-dicarboxylate transport system substrate-binding protein
MRGQSRVPLPSRRAGIRHVAAIVLAGIVIAACGGGGGSAEPTEEETDPGFEITIQHASYIGPDSADAIATRWWTEEVESRTEGRVTFELNFAGALLSAEDSLSGAGSGRADMVHIGPLYTPAELPLTQAVALPFRTANLPADNRALMDMYDNYEPFRNEFHEAGIEVLWFWSAGENILACTEPVSGPGDLDGRAVRTVGLGEVVVAATGAEVVALAFPEVRESLERGLLDCATHAPFDTHVNLGVHEVAPNLYSYGYGAIGSLVIAMNKGVWDSLPGDVQEIMLETRDELLDRVAGETYQEADAIACERLMEAGASLSLFDESAAEEWAELVGDEPLEVFVSNSADVGVEEDVAREFVERYWDSVERYEGEFADWEGGVEACATGS